MDGENKELKRCPFCGTVAEVVIQKKIGGMCAIRCLEFKCGALVFFDRATHSMAETQERWNRRFVEIRQYGEGGMRIGIIK